MEEALEPRTVAEAWGKLLPVAGEKSESPTPERLNGAEGALVEGQQAVRAIAMRQYDDRQIGQTEIQTGVAIVEYEGEAMLLRGQRFNLEAATR